jgi:hypothetical protein
MNNLNHLHPDLKFIKDVIYDFQNVELTNLKLNTESKEYGACSFELNGKKIIHRISKITPTKTGQFVTIWKRNEKGITEPFDSMDDFDFIIITSRARDHFGQFIFPKSILIENKIISHNHVDGKRGIRVYPPWVKIENKQAEKTQAWQKNHFINLKMDSIYDETYLLELLNS